MVELGVDFPFLCSFRPTKCPCFGHSLVSSSFSFPGATLAYLLLCWRSIERSLTIFFPFISEAGRGKKIKVLQGWPAYYPDINIIEHIWGRMKKEAWRTKPKNLEELWDACRWPSMPSPMTSSTSSKTLCQN